MTILETAALFKKLDASKENVGSVSRGWSHRAERVIVTEKKTLEDLLDPEFDVDYDSEVP